MAYKVTYYNLYWLYCVVVIYYSFKHVDLLTCLGTCYVGIHGSNKSYIGASQCKK